MTDGSNHSKIPKEGNRGAPQPLRIHGGISLSAGTGLNGIFAIGSRGFLDTAFPPPPSSCANQASGSHIQKKVTHEASVGLLPSPIEIPTTGKAEYSSQTLDHRISVAVPSVQVRNELC